MEKQHDIKGTLKDPAAIEIVRAMLASEVHESRAQLARAVCERFGFFDPCGLAQQGGCAKALKELERAGHFVLPAASPRGGARANSPRRLPEPLADPQDVPEKAGEVRGLTLIVVETELQMRTWNEMMLRDHPQGAGPLVGAQLRYLVGSEHGWLGGFGFAASARHLADRDGWIGWDAPTRLRHLNRVVGMSRFLIRPSVQCRNLASHLLGMVLRRLARDFEARYGYQPLLVESFVDTAHFDGTCYRAANWTRIGRTKGRGRQDRHRKEEKSVKEIYVYPLEADFRARLGVIAPAAPPALGIADGQDGDAWAEHEFGGAKVGDARLGARLVGSARALSTMPGSAYCAVAQGDKAAIKGHYRMIEAPDDAAMTMAAILAPHRRRTVQRMKAHRTVLCIQDGTDLNYNRLDQCTGLGVIGGNQTGAQSAGLHLHTTFAVTTEGLPLGVLGARCTAPPAKAKAIGTGAPAAPVPIELRKTFSWIAGVRECAALASELPDTRQVCVMDREADFFELFDEQRQDKRVDLLVRAKHDRVVGGELKLFDTPGNTPAKGRFRIPVPRQSARAKKSKQKARPKRDERTADVELRYQEVALPPPAHLKERKPVTLWVVHVCEPSPPDGAEALEWFLLTTCVIATAEQAEQCLRWYCLRWRIEDWHRVLKSGCKVEALQHKTAERLRRVIAINLVIAWRIMLMTLLGRDCPGLRAEILFSDVEIEVLAAYSKKKGSPSLPRLATPYAS